MFCAFAEGSMRTRFFVALTLALAVFPAAAQTPPAFPAGAESVDAKVMIKVGPQTRAWIRQTAASQRGSMLFSEAGAAQLVRGNPALAGLGANDIEALAFLVLMEAAKSANEDLKTIMDGVKQINSAKEGFRQNIARSNAATAGLDALAPMAQAWQSFFTGNGLSQQSTRH